MKNLNKLNVLILALFFGFMSCSDDDINTTNNQNDPTEDPGNQTEDPTGSDESGVLLSVDLDAQGLYPFHVIEDAETGTADIANAQELLNSDGAILVAIKDGFIYINDYTGETFKKLQVNDNGALVELGAVPNLGTNGNPLHTFLDDNRVLTTSKQTFPVDGVYSYQIINTSNMTVESIGTFNLPIQGDSNASFDYMHANEYVYFEGNVYIPFVEADALENALYDKAYVAVYDATTMEYIKKINTSYTASLCNGFNPSYAISEAGDLYLSSSNTNVYGVNETVPSGITRINSGTTDFDTNFFFDITAATGNHSLGMVYLGNNKAIVQVFNSELIDTSDFYVEYYIADLGDASMSKLDIPASKGGYYGGRRSMDLLGNGKAVIVTNNASESALYVYDPINDEVKKGTVYTGADAIVGLKAF
jgi:hypothetical protein